MREPSVRRAWDGIRHRAERESTVGQGAVGHGVVRQSALRKAAGRIDAATPADRDRAVDALRAFAILGVVLGHWLVTALVADGGSLHASSPLQRMPWLAPISWAFQTLAVFFLVGGHVATGSYMAARAKGTPYRQWLTARLSRLFRPVAAVLVLWTIAATALFLSGAEPTRSIPWSNSPSPPSGSCWSSRR